jgi:hypothetical protein
MMKVGELAARLRSRCEILTIREQVLKLHQLRNDPDHRVIAAVLEELLRGAELSNKEVIALQLSLEKMDGCEGGDRSRELDVACFRSLFVGENETHDPLNPLEKGDYELKVNLKFLSRNSQFKFRFPFFVA